MYLQTLLNVLFRFSYDQVIVVNSKPNIAVKSFFKYSVLNQVFYIKKLFRHDKIHRMRPILLHSSFYGLD